MTYKAGQTVYTENGKVYEFHHTHEGCHYGYPVMEFQDHNGEWHDIAAEVLVELRSISATPPVGKMTSEVKDLVEKINDLKAKKKEAHKELLKFQTETFDEKARLDQWNEKYETFKTLGLLLDGKKTLYFLVAPSHEWAVPEAAATRDVTALKLLWNPNTKSFRFVQKRRGLVGEDATINVFETLEELHLLVEVMFERCVKELRRNISNSLSPLDPGRTHQYPHISTLRDWVKKWPHLEIPKDLLEAEEAYKETEKKKKIEDAKKKLAELEGGMS